MSATPFSPYLYDTTACRNLFTQVYIRLSFVSSYSIQCPLCIGMKSVFFNQPGEMDRVVDSHRQAISLADVSISIIRAVTHLAGRVPVSGSPFLIRSHHQDNYPDRSIPRGVAESGQIRNKQLSILLQR